MVPGAAFVRRVRRPSTHRFHPSLSSVVDVRVSLGLRRRHGRTRTRLVVHAAPSVRLENVHWSSSRPRSNPTVPGFSDGSTSFLVSPRRTVRETSETPSLTSPQPTIRNVRENPTRTEPNRTESHPTRENILYRSLVACSVVDYDTTRVPARAARAARTWKKKTSASKRDRAEEKGPGPVRKVSEAAGKDETCMPRKGTDVPTHGP